VAGRGRALENTPTADEADGGEKEKRKRIRRSRRRSKGEGMLQVSGVDSGSAGDREVGVGGVYLRDAMSWVAR